MICFDKMAITPAKTGMYKTWPGDKIKPMNKPEIIAESENTDLLNLMYRIIESKINVVKTAKNSCGRV